MPLTFYDSGYLDVFNNDINWAADSIVAILLDDTYVPDQAAHATYVDVSGSEIADADYAQQSVPNRSIAQNLPDIRWHSDKVSWGADVSICARYLVLVKGTAGSLADTDPLLGYVDFGSLKCSENAEFSYTPATEGWFRVQR